MKPLGLRTIHHNAILMAKCAMWCLTYKVVAQDNINIVDWDSIIFKQMIGLLLLSLIIFLAVIALLYVSIKSLIKQKKIADVGKPILSITLPTN